MNRSDRIACRLYPQTTCEWPINRRYQQLRRSLDGRSCGV